MSWNRQNNDKQMTGGRTATTSARSHRIRRVRVLFAVLAGVGAVAGVWFFFRIPAPEPVRAERPASAAKALRHAVPKENMKKAAASAPAGPPIPGKRLTPEERAFAETNGLTKLQVQRWKIDRMPPAGYTNRSSQTETPPEYQIFKHASENEIAALLTLTPGETLVGSPSYERWFARDFQKSLREPIEITEDDTPEQVALKREMIAVKADLQARVAEGEDIAEIMRETRAEYQRLADYKQTIWDALREARRDPELTDEDIELFLEHANRKLEEKGIAPITLGPVTRHMLRLRKDIHQ